MITNCVYHRYFDLNKTHQRSRLRLGHNCYFLQTIFSCLFCINGSSESCGPFNLPNGAVVYSNPPEANGIYPVTTLADFTCDEGFTLVGPPQAFCINDFSSFQIFWFEFNQGILGDTRSTPRCEGNKLRLFFVWRLL